MDRLNLASGETLDFLLEAWPDSVLVYGGDGKLLLANRTAREWFAQWGLTPGESLDRLHNSVALFEPVTKAPVPEDRLPLVRALRGETVPTAEYLIRASRTGAHAWVECTARPIADPDGGICGAVLSARDVTERKQREFQKRSTDELMDFVYQGNLAGILHTAVDGRILDCNEALVRMLGYSSRQELMSLRMQQLHYDPEERNRILRRLRSAGTLTHLEVAFRSAMGARVWTLMNVCMLEPHPDKVGGDLIATVVDITERKLWEETVRQSEQRFTAFMHHLPGIAYIKDGHGRYVYFNEALRRLFGRQPEEIVGKTDEAIWPAEDRGQSRENDARVMESGKPVEFVQKADHADGQHSWLISKFPIFEDGRTALVGGVGVDITARLALEAQLTQAGKMEALGRLAGGVAHDFNNLLTVISGYGQLALETIGSAPPERITSYVQEILTSARRAAGLTGQLLAFSRRQTSQPKTIDLCELVRGMEGLLQRMIGEYIDLTVQCVDEPCIIHADTQQVEQVLMNLSVNARDAMPLGGTLQIECRGLREPVMRRDAGPFGVILKVRDTGIGMEESVRLRIFEPFFTSKEKAKGTGLGLSTVYGIVTQANGLIEVESEPGEGTTFSIYLPAAQGRPERAAAASPSIGGTNSESAARKDMVLLVEDDASVRSLVEAILRRLGFDVLVAESGASAIELWQKKQAEIDILLTDVIMPHMSGYELAQRLRAIRPDLKVLFMSGYTDEIIERTGVLTGETQLINKPFTAEQLGQRLRALLKS